MKCVDAVVLRIRTGRVVYAASRNDRHVGALSDKEIVIYGIFEIADRKQYGDMHRLVFYAGLYDDVNAVLVCL